MVTVGAGWPAMSLRLKSELTTKPPWDSATEVSRAWVSVGFSTSSVSAALRITLRSENSAAALLNSLSLTGIMCALVPPPPPLDCPGIGLAEACSALWAGLLTDGGLELPAVERDRSATRDALLSQL